MGSIPTASTNAASSNRRPGLSMRVEDPDGGLGLVVPLANLGIPAKHHVFLCAIADKRAVQLLDQAEELLLQVAPLIAACPGHRQPERARAVRTSRRRRR